jgi:hypothetical protein
LRDFFGRQDDEGGVRLTNIIPFSPADGRLKSDDVLLAIDGVPIAEDGTFEFRRNERLAFSHLINRKQANDTIDLLILRKGKKISVQIPLSPAFYLLAPPNTVAQPSYYIYGGVVFTVLTMDLVTSWGERWWERAPFNFLHFLAGEGRYNPERLSDVVILLDILPDDQNVGYSDSALQAVVSVNGKRFKSFKEFVRLVEKLKGEHAVFEAWDGSKIIISRQDMGSITDNIIRRNNIPSQFSADVEQWIKKDVDKN